MKPYPPRSLDEPGDSRFVPRPVFGIDIDGTLGAYHEHFHAFASAWLGRDLPPVSGFREGSFAKYLGLSKDTYRKIKLAYRRGGAKRSMPAFDGARDLTASLRQRGAVVVLCTTRPYLSLENIDEDTRHWAKRNKIQNDLILWGEHKYRDLRAVYGPRIVAALEDEPAMLDQAWGLGIQTVAHLRPYNSDMSVVRADKWVADLDQAKIYLHDQLSKWEVHFR